MVGWGSLGERGKWWVGGLWGRGVSGRLGVFGGEG